MIPLERIRTEEAVHKNFKGDKRIKREKKLLEDQRKIKRDELEEHSFDSNYWKKAKDQLKLETHNKCAYCEAPTSMVAYGDVEHYRPKSKYWWLAYNLDNYLVSCQLCNQKFKGAKFPISGSSLKAPRITTNTTDDFIESHQGTCGPDPLNIDTLAPNTMTVNEFEVLHLRERPFLLNPYLDNPADFYAWAVDDTIREVELTPLNDNVKKFWEAAEKDYGLNRPELKQLRYFIYMLYRTFKNTLKDQGISPATRQENENAINEMKADTAPFAGMIRFFENKAPAPVP